MKKQEPFRDLYCPYEIAVMGLLITYGLALAGLAALATARIGLGLLMLIAAMIIGILFQHSSRCPACGKAPMIRARGEVPFLLYKMASRRFWPERRCSECGAALDDPPASR